MKQKKRFPYFFELLLLLQLSGYTASSQSQRLDSLLNAVQHMKEDTVKANAFYEISKIYLHDQNNIAKVGEYGRKELALAQKLNFKKGIANAMINMGVFYRIHGNYQLDLYYTENALKLMKELGNKYGEGICYSNIGLAYSERGEYKIALEYMEKSMKIVTAIGNKKGAAIVMNNMANIFQTQGNYAEAINYHLKALRVREEIQDKNGIASSYNNIGNVLDSQLKFDEALGYYFKSAKILEELKDVNTISTIYGNIGNTYLEKLQLKEALVYLIKESKANEQTGNKKNIAHSYLNIGNIYLKQEKPAQALVYQLKGYALCKEIEEKKGMTLAAGGVGKAYEYTKNYKEALLYYEEMLHLAKELNFRVEITTAYENLSSVYKKQNQFEKALKYTELYNTIKDSLLNKENFRQVTELNTRYETDKKEKEILLLTKDQELNAKIIKQQRLERWALIIGLVLLCVSIISIYRRYRFKKIANVTLEKQKEEIQLTVTELTQAKDELHKAVEQKEKLTSILAHDLRTPLRFISTISAYLHKNADSIALEELEELTGELSTSSKSTFALADELLTWLSIQGHNFKVICEKVDVKRLLEELRLFFSDIAKMKNVEIKVSIQQPFFIETDEKLLKIILRNVVDNAIKNTVKGTITLSVSKPVNGSIEIQIQDTGRGMTREQLEKLNLENTLGFPFEIKDKLGFQIVKDLTFFLNGSVAVKSEIEKGTTVILCIPSKEPGTDALSV